jgi:hypothetical protein
MHGLFAMTNRDQEPVSKSPWRCCRALPYSRTVCGTPPGPGHFETGSKFFYFINLSA